MITLYEIAFFLIQNLTIFTISVSKILLIVLVISSLIGGILAYLRIPDIQPPIDGKRVKRRVAYSLIALIIFVLLYFIVLNPYIASEVDWLAKLHNAIMKLDFVVNIILALPFTVITYNIFLIIAYLKKD